MAAAAEEADHGGAAAKKAAAARSWMVVDATGERTVLDVDKYAIMHRVEIHARDLRILDPLLSYPSAILGREKAIVLNLEVFGSIPCEFSYFFRIFLLIFSIIFFSILKQ